MTAFPKEHVLARETICGQTFKEGDAIPAQGKWSETGSDGSCKAVPGGDLFYAYNYPAGASSNTGFEQAEELLYYFVVDDSNLLSFVVVNDKAGTGTGGAARFALETVGLRGSSANVLRFDDPVNPSTCNVNEPNVGALPDCYEYSPQESKGTFSWRWSRALPQRDRYDNGGRRG